MIKNSKKVVGLLTVILIALGISTMFSFNVYATVLDIDTCNNVIYPHEVYKQGIQPPYSVKEAVDEHINPATGNLEIKQTDLYLKGKNGLDFALTRYYSLQQAVYYEPYIRTIEYYTSSGEHYYGQEYVEDGETIYKKRFDLGIGWTFDLPFIEIRDDHEYLHYGSSGVWEIQVTSYYSGDSNLKDYPLRDMVIDNYHDQYIVGGKYAAYVLSQKDGRKTYFSGDGLLMAIEDRYGNRITFYYEGSQDKRIKKIIDSVGREINIYYNSYGDVEITVNDPTDPNKSRTIFYDKSGNWLVAVEDAEDRRTEYEYTDGLAEYSYSCKNAGGDPEEIWVVKDGTTWLFYCQHFDNKYACLKQITYPSGGKTAYGYEKQVKSLGEKGSMEFYKVTGRTDYDGDYTYEFPYSSYSDDHPPFYNHKTFDYGYNQYDGFPNYYYENLPNSHECTTVVEDYTTSVTQTYTYNGKMLCTEYVEEGQEHKKEVINEYDLDKKLLTKKISRSYKKGTNDYVESVENFEYDNNNYRDLVAYWDPQAARASNGDLVSPLDEHKTSYSYNGIYHYITEKTYRKDANTWVKEEYQPTSDSKSIHWSIISEMDAGDSDYTPKAKTEYLYDAYGNIIEERRYLEDGNWTQYIASKFSYEDDEWTGDFSGFNGAYMTRKWIEGVKDADGNLVQSRPGISNETEGNTQGTVDEKYEYDWWGNMTQKQDAVGVCTSYQYDKLDRAIRETHADSSFKTWQYITNQNENSATLTNENGDQFKYGYDKFGNLIYEQDVETGELINCYDYDSGHRVIGEYNYDGRATSYCYDSAGRITLKEIKNEYVWFDNSLPAGSTLISDYWYWVWEDSIRNNYCANNTSRYGGHLQFETTLKPMKVYQGDSIFIEYKLRSGTEELLIEFKTDDSKRYLAYWGYNEINFNEEDMEVALRIGDIPVFSSWDTLVIPASLMQLEGKNITGMKFQATEYSACCNRVGIYRDSQPSNVIYRETYSYEDANQSNYTKVTKTIEGDASSPTITTNTYTNKLGQVVKQERVHDENGTIKYYSDTFKYDYVGNKTEELFARAEDEGWTETYTKKYEYDYAGNVVKEYNINDDYVETKYDALGRVVKLTDIKGGKATEPYYTTYEYDSMDRLIKETIPFKDDGSTRYYSIKKHYYDRNGNTTSEKVTNNQPAQSVSYSRTDYEYNSRNMLMKVTTYDNGIPENYTQYYYDAAGNKRRMYTGLSSPLAITGLDSVTPGGDTEYSVTQYDFDRFGNLTSMTDPLGNIETYTYDLNGSMIHKVDRNGNTTSIDYDALGRITEKTVTTPDGSGNGSYTYTYTLTGQMASKTGSGVDATYTYDDLGRRKTETGPNGITKEYTYDAANNRISFTLKQNGTARVSTTYTYDNQNRLYQVYENGQLKATYTYDGNGNRETLAYTNGNSTAYGYNLANRVTSLTNKKGSEELSNYTYSYYLDGNQQKKADTISGKSSEYLYDDLGRLESETEKENGSTVSAISYTYDDNNNRYTMTKDESLTEYEYDENNRLTKETTTSGDETTITSYSYDKNGNQKSKSVETIRPVVSGEGESFSQSISGEGGERILSFYEYDGFNQLIKVTSGDMTATYIYNDNGLRTSKTVNGATTNHIWDGGQIAVETNAEGTVTNKYIRGINLIYTQDGAGTQRHYLYNAHGDVVQLTSSNGTVTKTYDYDAFGNEKNPDDTDTNIFRYCGEYFDKETGTLYLRARYYDPTIGRFITEDSYMGKAKDPLSLNIYLYCGNNPIRYYDPDGRFWKEIADLWKNFFSGFGEYAEDDAYGEDRYSDLMKISSDNFNAADYMGYQTAEWIDTHNIYYDITFTIATPITDPITKTTTDFAIGITHLSGTENYSNASYVHVGAGKSVSLAPLGLSFTMGLVDNANTAQDFAGPFIDINANGFIGIDYAVWKEVSSTGITISTTPSAGGRVDYYFLIKYTDDGIDVYQRE